jgi:IMP dehydrogenase/GMP reductase
VPLIATALHWLLQVGGMGFIHYNCTIAEQAAAVAKVKAHCPGFVVTPICMKPTDTISALDNLKVRRQGLRA